MFVGLESPSSLLKVPELFFEGFSLISGVSPADWFSDDSSGFESAPESSASSPLASDSSLAFAAFGALADCQSNPTSLVSTFRHSFKITYNSLVDTFTNFLSARFSTFVVLHRLLLFLLRFRRWVRRLHIRHSGLCNFVRGLLRRWGKDVRSLHETERERGGESIERTDAIIGGSKFTPSAVTVPAPI